MTIILLPQQANMPVIGCPSTMLVCISTGPARCWCSGGCSTLVRRQHCAALCCRGEQCNEQPRAPIPPYQLIPSPPGWLQMGNLGIISLLCSRDANVDATKTTGSTPLHTAADVNQTAAVRLLLSAPCNADPHALMSGDTTPLYLAAQVWGSASAEHLCHASLTRTSIHQQTAWLD